MQKRPIAKRPARLSVIREPGEMARLTLTIQFNPDERGPERTQAIWQGIAQTIGALLDPDEIPVFLRELETAKNSALLQRPQASEPENQAGSQPKEDSGERGR